MLFAADRDDIRRSLQKSIASEIYPHVDEWEKSCLLYWGGTGFTNETPVSRAYRDRRLPGSTREKNA